MRWSSVTVPSPGQALFTGLFHSGELPPAQEINLLSTIPRVRGYFVRFKGNHTSISTKNRESQTITQATSCPKWLLFD